MPVLRLASLHERPVDLGLDELDGTKSGLPVERDIPVRQVLTDRLNQSIRAISPQLIRVRMTQQI